MEGATQPQPNATYDKWVYSFGGIVKNTGIGTLHDVTVTDTFTETDTANISPAGDGSSLVRTYDIGDLTSGQCKHWPYGQVVDCDTTDLTALTVAQLGTFETFTNGGELDRARVDAALAPAGDKIVGYPETAGDTVTASCPVGAGTPAISVEKHCATSVSSAVAVTITVTGEVCNQSAFPVSGLSATDVQTKDSGATEMGSAHSITLGGTSLASCPTPSSCDSSSGAGVCVSISDSYSPSQVSSGTDKCDYFFEDKVKVSGDVSLLGTTVDGDDTVNCPLCGCGSTP